MARMLYCVCLMVPLGGMSVVAFRLSTTFGILAAAVATVLAIPLTLSAVAHFDLRRTKAHYGFSDSELREFTRLVPQLVGEADRASRSPGELKRAAKQTAADIIIRQRHGERPTSAGA